MSIPVRSRPVRNLFETPPREPVSIALTEASAITTSAALPVLSATTPRPNFWSLGTSRFTFDDSSPICRKKKELSSPLPEEEEVSYSKPAPQSPRFEDEVGDTGSPQKKGPICPSAPKKAKAAFSPVEEVITAGKPFTIRKWIDQSEITLVPIRRLGAGMHGTAWLVRMSDGSPRVYKVDEETNNSFVKEELYQYAQLRSIGFPVAIHHDLEPFINMAEFKAIFANPNKRTRDQALLQFVSNHVTHKYHLRDYVENRFPSHESTPLESPLYDQLKGMMKSAYVNRIAVDLQRANVGFVMVDELDLHESVSKVPKVVYYDLMPHDEVDTDKYGMQREDENPFGMIVKQCLKTFAPEGHAIYAKLDPR